MRLVAWGKPLQLKLAANKQKELPEERLRGAGDVALGRERA
jgi:hypothetical protein